MHRSFYKRLLLCAYYTVCEQPVDKLRISQRRSAVVVAFHYVGLHLALLVLHGKFASWKYGMHISICLRNRNYIVEKKVARVIVTVDKDIIYQLSCRQRKVFPHMLLEHRAPGLRIKLRTHYVEHCIKPYRFFIEHMTDGNRFMKFEHAHHRIV